MNPTEMTIATFPIGFDLQKLKWNAWKKDYARIRNQLNDNIKKIGLDLTLPNSIAEYDLESDNIHNQIAEHLKSERARLGGDPYALTNFYLGYIPLELVLSASWKSENYEPLLWLIDAVLIDFGIESEFDSIKKFLDTETLWLAHMSKKNDGNIRVSDALQATLRLINRISTLWKLAEKYDTPIQFDRVPYYSVFISFSFNDEEFVTKLYNYLTESGIRAWYAPHDIKPGQKMHYQIYDALESYDKLLIVLSESSMESSWVGTELYKARQREITEKVQMIFPISLVPFNKIRTWSSFDADTGKDLAREIREYYIPNFSKWRNDAEFENEIQKLLEALVDEKSLEIQST